MTLLNLEASARAQVDIHMQTNWLMALLNRRRRVSASDHVSDRAAGPGPNGWRRRLGYARQNESRLRGRDGGIPITKRERSSPGHGQPRASDSVCTESWENGKGRSSWVSSYKCQRCSQHRIIDSISFKSIAARNRRRTPLSSVPCST